MNNGKSKKQLLEELIQAQKALEEKVETQDQMIKRFEALASQEDLFVKVMDYFPYPIMVFSPDGILEMANKTLLTETGIKDIETAINISDTLGCCKIRLILRRFTSFLSGGPTGMERPMCFTALPKVTARHG